MQINNPDVKNAMVKEMLSADSYLPFLADQYGNYVVQKTLAVAEPEDLEQLLVKIKPDMKQLRETSDFGQKIYNKLVKTYPYLENKGLKVKTKTKRTSQKSNRNSQKDKNKKNERRNGKSERRKEKKTCLTICGVFLGKKGKSRKTN